MSKLSADGSEPYKNSLVSKSMLISELFEAY
jgi:hypothetical protein